MKQFIISARRPQSIKTHHLLPEALILLDNDEEYIRYSENPTINKDRLINLKQPSSSLGKAYALNRIFDEFVSHDEWVIIADDNLVAIEAVPLPWRYNEHQDFSQKPPQGWHKTYQHRCDSSEVLAIADEWRDKAIQLGHSLICAGENRNYFFRGKRWREIGLAQAKFSVQKNWGFRYPDDIVSKADDTLLTAENLIAFKGLLIDNYVYPVRTGFNEPGGHGILSERFLIFQLSYEKLENQYPQLFKRKQPPNFTDPYYFLDIRPRTKKALEKWLRSYESIRDYSE